MKKVHKVKATGDGQQVTMCGVAPLRSEMVTTSWSAATCEECHRYCTLPHSSDQKWIGKEQEHA